MSLFRCLSALLVATLAILSPAARAADDFLDPDQAFQLTAKALDDHRVELDYRIAPGYYLYRERFHFDAPGATQGPLQIPPGRKHYDTSLEQEVETYTDAVSVVLPFTKGPASFELVATHQGCAEKGLCYPPQTRTLRVQLKGLGAAVNDVTLVKAGDATAPAASPALTNSPAAVSARDSLLGLGPKSEPAATSPATVPATSAETPADTGVAAATASPPPPAPDDGTGRLGEALRGARLGLALALAFGLGLVLAATPCVWPMFPILASIIVGQGEPVTRGRGFSLAVAYSLGMALVYTALGVIAASIGSGLQGYLQQPAVLVGFGLLLALLSLSMFGVYELQLPAFLRDRLSAHNARLSGGQVGGVFAMGVLSALIVSPCVSAPLVTVLAFIGTSHDKVLGGSALFAMAAGMSVPLLVIGATAGTLPRSGAWMNRVKHACGLLLLAVAIYVMQPALPVVLAMGLWGALAIVGASSLGAFESVPAGPHAPLLRAFKGLGLVLALLGLLEFVGIASGGRDPAEPLGRLAQARGNVPDEAVAFERVASVADLDRRVQAAGKPVMLDFYADWCVSCKEMEKQTFREPAVRARLQRMVLLRADVTANSEDDRALLKRFGLYGPPGIIFFDAKGAESPTRVIGYQAPATFQQSLDAAGV